MQPWVLFSENSATKDDAFLVIFEVKHKNCDVCKKLNKGVVYAWLNIICMTERLSSKK